MALPLTNSKVRLVFRTCVRSGQSRQHVLDPGHLHDTHLYQKQDNLRCDCLLWVVSGCLKKKLLQECCCHGHKYEHGRLKNGWFWGQKQVTMAGSVWCRDSLWKLFITSNHINTNRKTWFRAVLTPASQKWQFLSWKPGHNGRVTQGPWNHHGNFLMPQITSILIGKHDHENEDGLTHVHIHLNYYISIMLTQIMSKNCFKVREWF